MSERQPQPALRPTEPATLVVAGLAAAAVAWLLISNFYQDLPPMIWPPVIIIAGLAAFEAVVARQLWVRIHRRSGLLTARQRADMRPGAGEEPVEPLAVARYAVLAKASSVAGAIFTGFYAGFVPWLLIESGRVSDAAADLPPTIGGLVASALFMASALWLERACRVPEQPDDQPPSPPDADPT
jgi:Protein of unknown function (DUF3180)